MDNLTYADVEIRGRLLNGSTLLNGFGGLLTVGGLAMLIAKKPPVASALTTAAGLGNIGLGVAAIRRADQTSPLQWSDTAMMSARPVAELLTTVPGMAMTGSGVSQTIDDLVKNKITLSSGLRGAGLAAAGVGAVLAGGYANRMIQDKLNHDTARRLGVGIPISNRH